MKYHAEIVCRHIRYRCIEIHKSYVEVIYFVVYLPYQEFCILYSHVFKCRYHCEIVNVENTKLALRDPELLARLEFFIDIIHTAELWLWSRLNV